ncbi:MAG: hypothetical protein ACE3L7_17535 [Candidatus Pristimantibacillus sp.]
MYIEIQWMKVISYLSSKLASASLLTILFWLITSGFDLYSWSESLEGPFILVFFYGYAIGYSMLVDLLLFKVTQNYRIPIGLLLHFAGGYIPFLFMSSGVFIFLFAGTIGAACAFVFYGIDYFIRKIGQYSIVVAVLLLGVIITVATVDFTITKQWKLERTDTSYEASFSQFNGKKAIVIDAVKDQVITFSVKWFNENGGGHGMHVLDDKGDYVGMKSLGSNKQSFVAERTGAYSIIITGDELEGSVSVKWEIE